MARRSGNPVYAVRSEAEWSDAEWSDAARGRVEGDGGCHGPTLTWPLHLPGSMYDAVLVPTDGSDAASAGVTHGLDLAAAFDAVVHALYVVQESENTSIVGGAGGPDDESIQSIADRATETVAAAADDRGLDTETAVRTGTPHREILDYATDADVDLVVMATHGRSGISRFLGGSVTERVVRNADRPVLVARRES